MAAPQLPVLASDNNLPAVISDVQLDKIHKPMQGVLLGLDILHKAQPTAQGTKDVIDDENVMWDLIGEYIFQRISF